MSEKRGTAIPNDTQAKGERICLPIHRRLRTHRLSPHSGCVVYFNRGTRDTTPVPTVSQAVTSLAADAALQIKRRSKDEPVFEGKSGGRV